jgi:adenosylmethionine-8-amino-7-oxononanoate transaminase
MNLEEKDRKFIWHPFTQFLEWERDKMVIIERGDGIYLWDVDGNKYIDGVSSLWVNLHGHRNPYLDRAVINQLKKISHSTFLGLSHRPAIELAELLIKISPGLNRVFYSDNGSTAVEVGLKVAYQFFRNQGVKKRDTFLCLKNGYHGDTIGAVSVGGIELFHGVYKKLCFKTLKAPSPYCYRCEFGLHYPQCGLLCAEELEKMVKRNRDRLCGIIIEPKVQAAGGIIVMPEGYLKAVEETARKNDVLLIVDEVATGFGRTGRIFACEHEDIKPDIMALSKSITGGYLPLAVTLFKEEIFSAFKGKHSERKTFYHGHTYTANPLACAVSIENIKLLLRKFDSYKKKIKFIEKEMDRFKELPLVGDVRGCGFMWGIELVKDKRKKTQFHIDERTGHRICMEMRKRGVILRPLGDVIVILPPLSIKEREFKKITDSLYDLIKGWR